MIHFFARILFAVLCSIHLCLPVNANTTKSVNVYCWAYVLQPEILKQFEMETGIKVNLDVYDTPEVMETKLFTGKSGYDVVVVTVWPYLPHQIKAHIYQPLDKSVIPNWKNVDPVLLKKMEDPDPQNMYAVPFIWGTNGFAYNKKKILERLPNAPVESLSMLFDPQVVSKFADCGVMLVDSPIEVFPSALVYLGFNPNSSDEAELLKASNALQQVRPYIRKFVPNPPADSLTSGNYCLVQGFSGDLNLARELGKNTGLNIEYVIPKEGTSIWIDAFAIPRDAPHAEEARAFINFMLRPEIMAKITNAITTANSVPSSRQFVKESIRNDPLIYPSKETIAKLYVDKTQPPNYVRKRLREWIRIKTGR